MADMMNRSNRMHDTTRDRTSGNYWGKAALAGLIGGLAIGYLMAGSAMYGAGLWQPANVIGDTFMDGGATVGTFLASLTLTGVVLHLVTSAFWGLVFGAIAAYMAPRILHSYGRSAIAGALYGVGVWLVMGLLIGPLFNPAVLIADGTHYFISHVIYGVLTALSLTAMTHRGDVSVTYAPERARVRDEDHVIR